MNKITCVKNKDYTTISNVFMRDMNLSLKAKGLLALIMSLSDDWDFSIVGISKIIKEGKTAIYSAIDELKKNGYCVVMTIRDDKGVLQGNDYFFYETPINSIVGENPYAENPNMDNKPQISIDIKNKQEKEKKEERFKKPTIEEIQAYINEKSYHFDAETFFAFYESKGWKVGTSPMKKWQAACVTWERSYLQKHPNSKPHTPQCQKDDSVTIGGQTYK